jgi:hypothetical protein
MAQLADLLVVASETLRECAAGKSETVQLEDALMKECLVAE